MNNIKRYTLYILNIVDMLAIAVSFLLAYFIRFRIMNDVKIYVPLSDYTVYLLLSFVAYVILNELYIFKNSELMRYTSIKLFTESIKISVYLIAIVVILLNFMKANSNISRVYEVINIAVLCVVDFIGRTLAKKVLTDYFQKTGAAERIVLYSDAENLENALRKTNQEYDWRNRIVGIFLDDAGEGDSEIEGIRVYHDLKELENVDYDSVLLAITGNRVIKKEKINYFKNIGKLVHVYVREYDYEDDYRNVDSIGDMAVVTYRSIPPMPKRQIIFKRLCDIVLSLLLLLPYLFLFILVLIFTNLESRGAVIIPRVRVGKNSIRFYQYRFRVYRHDAEERIKAGKSPFTVIGRILRKTHLDGAPMLLNILGGDMSFIGPKAPNLAKYMNMTPLERSALAMKPGAMGYWSVRSEMDIIRANDQKYNENWSIFRDLSIYALMVIRYLVGKSLRIDGDTHIDEELRFCRELNAQEREFEYDRSLYHGRQGFSHAIYLLIKRTFDIIVSLVALILLAIPMLIVALLVTLDDGGNPIYKHKRVGKDGKYLYIYKFRSMVTNAGDLESLLTPEQLEQYRREFKIDNDPRITNVGAFIRKTSIDELPQLINILNGSLSVVGPRPVLDEELRENYSDEEIARFLSVTPGLTGYWQAYARNRATYETGERQQMEMYYVDHQSLWLDIRIFFQTFVSVLKRDGAQ